MKTTLIPLLLTILCIYLAGLFLPWWSLALVMFVIQLLRPSSSALRSWIIGFGAVFLFWTVLASWIDYTNGHLLSQRIASILPFRGNTFFMIMATGIIGGLVGGMAAYSAYLVHRIKCR